MDISARDAVREALNKAKICNEPILCYYMLTHRAYIEKCERYDKIC